jgi:small-conductance mechanosensitive channel
MWDLFVLNLILRLEALSASVGAWLGEHLLNILVILFGAWLLRHFGARLISRMLGFTIRPDLYPTKADRQKRLETLNSLGTAAMRVTVYIVAGIMIISELGINTGPIIASAGVIGIALGFGAKSLIQDFLSGIFIITENQYRVGDIVEIGSVSGIVESVTIRTTVLRDLNGHVHHVPNGTIQVTTNMTADFSQINEDIVVGLDTDMQRLERIINHVGQELSADVEFKKQITEAPYMYRMEGYDANGIIVKVLAKVQPGMQWDIKSELYKRLKVAFEKNDIEIPYQHIMVHEVKK